MMRRRNGFALLEVLLAVILMMVAAAASYTLVKSFRTNSATQQFVHYATDITQSISPFLGSGNSTILSGDKLSTSFLTSIGIPNENFLSGSELNETSAAACSDEFCYVDSGMSVQNKKSAMSFTIKIDKTYQLSNYFLIATLATGAQVNQVLQNAASLFSIYCVHGSDKTLPTGTLPCGLLPESQANETYALWLVFPKSGNTPPDINTTEGS